MKRILFFILFSFGLFTVQAQNYWKTYRDTDGLANQVATSLAVHNKVIYAATPTGLSVLENGVFTNFDTSNSTLPSQNIRLIKNYRDTIWMATDSGLTEFINGQMTHYSDTNGLLNKVIQDMGVDSKGNLWIASFDGLTKKEGAVFTSEAGRKIFNIAINKGDSIYANVRFESIVNAINPVTAEIFDGTTWTPVRDTNLITFINKAKFVNLNDSLVGILSNDGRVFQVDSIFNLRLSQLPDSSLNNTFLSDMAMDSRGNVWYSFLPNQFFLEGGMLRFDGNDYEFFSAGLPASRVYDIETEGNIVYLATENGISFAVDTIKPIPTHAFLETSSIKVRINADGTLFRTNIENLPANDNGFNYPKGSNKNMIFSSGLWMSEESDSSDKKLAIQKYDRGDFSIGTINSNGNLVSETMIEISKSEIDFHLENYGSAGYQMPVSIRNWPGNGSAELGEESNQAPFVDGNNNGCYDPENGDYPYIIGDRAVYLVINDAGSSNTGQAVSNLNTEVQLLVYVFDQPTIDYLDKTIFVRYIINNRSDKDYEGLKTGFFYDFDLGDFADDYFGSDPGSDIFYTYNSDNNDQSGNAGYGTTIPSLGVKMINRQMDGFMGYSGFSSNSSVSDPITAAHYSNAMNYLWNDGTPITQFESGYNPGFSNTTNFMYNGNIFNANEWSALNPGPGLIPSSGSDIRGMGVADPFDLKPNEKYVIDVAIGVGLDSTNIDYLDNVTLMINNLNRAANFQRGLISILPDPTYATCITGILENNVNQGKKAPISLYPNPTSREVNVLAQEGILEIQIANLQGQVVVRYVELGGSNIQKINLPQSIPNGIYMVQVMTENGTRLSQKLIIQH